MTSQSAERQPPPGHPRFALLDGIRAIAALAVVGKHIGDSTGFSDRDVLGALSAKLNVGVTIFFVLSGFLLYRPFAAARLAGRPRPTVGRYLRRRALRIIPAFWFAFGVLWLLGWITVLDGQWWRYLLFLQNQQPGTIFSGIRTAWTLDVEVAFYISLPFWALLLDRVMAGRSVSARIRVELIALTAAAALSIFLRFAISHHNPTSLRLVQFPTFLAWFAGGMALALMSIHLERGGAPGRLLSAIAARPWISWLIAAVAYVIATFCFDRPRGFEGTVSAVNDLARQNLFLIVALAVTLPAILPAHISPREGDPVHRLLSTSLMAWLGLVSYGLFLWHQPFLEWMVYDHHLAERIPVAPMVGVTALTVLGGVALGAVSYYLVEKPFLRLKEPRRARARPSAG